MPLSGFHPAIARWFTDRFAEPTEPQRRAWPLIQGGRNALIAAPTGSGKTFAAFLAAIDSLLRQGLDGTLGDEKQVVYVSPLKALSNDVQKNLAEPLAEIRRTLEALCLPDVDIRTLVRTGDTPAPERQQMVKRPPHVLVTTPESLYLILTSERARDMLRTVRTVIVDEIHAVARDKRGSHLALSLERLEHLAGRRLQRVGLSATQKPIEDIAAFLAGTRHPTPDTCIIDAGHARSLDLAIEIPSSPLEAVMAAEVWDEIYERLVQLIGEHRTTLVFVNTRRLAERLTLHLSERLGADQVTSHHGSLSKEKRLDAETRLKEGKLKALVATASLELGVDIGAVDLVCQIGSTRSIATLLQRVGRSGHHLAAVPRGRLFPLSRDELLECAALVRATHERKLDRLVIPEHPLDILAQQIVAAAAGDEWEEDRLYELVRGAYPYRELSRKDFDDVVRMLAEGFTTRRGRRGAYLHHDGVNRRVRARRGARLAALTSGGAIPDIGDYRVVLEPTETFVGTLNEDFAIESMPGDIFQLGNTSYLIQKIEAGQVRVVDAHGQPPSIPFWLGEAPGRTPELSEEVSRLRQDIGDRLADPGSAVAWLASAIPGLPEAAARQLVDYLDASKKILGVIPTQQTLVLERFFDEAGGMQLVLHAPFGSRLNRAWGLALRKRFCRSFNFELQAAATEDAIVLSLGPQHSFPLEDVFQYLKPETAEHLLVQAMLDAPMFGSRWRWNATRALAVLRARGGKKVPTPLQRMEAEDLIAAVFPDQLACPENLVGDREIPDHPLVNQTIADCLLEAMDFPGLKRVLEEMAAGRFTLVARDTTWGPFRTRKAERGTRNNRSISRSWSEPDGRGRCCTNRGSGSPRSGCPWCKRYFPGSRASPPSCRPSANAPRCGPARMRCASWCGDGSKWSAPPRRRSWPAPSAFRSRTSTSRSARSSTRGSCCAAGSPRTRRSSSGASGGCWLGSIATRSTGCGGRSSPSAPPTSCGSCAAGSAPRRRLGRRDRRGSPRCSSCSTATRFRQERGSRTCCPRGSGSTIRCGSTGCVSPARSPGAGCRRPVPRTATSPDQFERLRSPCSEGRGERSGGP